MSHKPLIDPSITDALQRGYPTRAEQRSWKSAQWDAFNYWAEKRKAREREDYEAGNSPERLRELIEELTARIAALESKP